MAILSGLKILWGSTSPRLARRHGRGGVAALLIWPVC